MLPCFTEKYHFVRHVTAPQIEILGTAVFEAETPFISRYFEHGYYWLNGEKHECYQTRYFVSSENHLHIQKQNRSPLHTFMLPKSLSQYPMILQHTHLCNRDQYTISLKIESPDKFETYYEISGPLKKNTIKTLYARNSTQNISL